MADLVVLGFPSKEKAEAVLTLAGQLVKEELLDLEDAALVWVPPRPPAARRARKPGRAGGSRVAGVESSQ